MAEIRIVLQKKVLLSVVTFVEGFYKFFAQKYVKTNICYFVLYVIVRFIFDEQNNRRELCQNEFKEICNVSISAQKYYLINEKKLSLCGNYVYKYCQSV